MSNIQCYEKNKRRDVYSRTWLRKIKARDRLLKKLNELPADERKELSVEYAKIMRTA